MPRRQRDDRCKNMPGCASTKERSSRLRHGTATSIVSVLLSLEERGRVLRAHAVDCELQRCTRSEASAYDLHDAGPRPSRQTRRANAARGPGDLRPRNAEDGFCGSPRRARSRVCPRPSASFPGNSMSSRMSRSDERARTRPCIRDLEPQKVGSMGFDFAMPIGPIRGAP